MAVSGRPSVRRATILFLDRQLALIRFVRPGSAAFACPPSPVAGERKIESSQTADRNNVIAGIAQQSPGIAQSILAVERGLRSRRRRSDTRVDSLTFSLIHCLVHSLSLSLSLSLVLQEARRAPRIPMNG